MIKNATNNLRSLINKEIPLTKLRVDAEKATPGKWQAGFYDGRGGVSVAGEPMISVCRSSFRVYHHDTIKDEYGDPVIDQVESIPPCTRHDAIHIANCSPENILLLLNYIRGLEEFVEDVKTYCNDLEWSETAKEILS